MKKPLAPAIQLFVCAGLLSTLAVLTGCGSGSTATTPPPVTPTPPTPPSNTYTGVAFSATVQAGGQAVSGATMALYAAGTTGSGSLASSLLNSAATTDATGNVTVPATYNCPSTGSLVYLVSTGGTVAGTSAANASLTFVSPAGLCGSITTTSKFILNEATTAATAVALAQFYKPSNGIGASSTNAAGLANAFATAATLADPVTGSTPGLTLPANAVSPAPIINSLANALNGCALSPAACQTLFSAVAPTGTAPTNTFDAIHDLMLAPAANVSAVYLATRAGTAYRPALASAPADWTVYITYSGGGLNSPGGLGVDSTGSVWVANYFNVASKFSPIGAPDFAGGITGFGLNNSYGLAIDLNDNAWIPNEQPSTKQGIGSVSVLTPAGASAAGSSGYTAGGLNYPLSIAIDPNGTAWVVDYGNSHVTLLSASGQPLSGATGYTNASFAFPDVVAVDGSHNGWIGNLSSTNVVKIAPDGSSLTTYNCCEGAAGIAFDAQGNAWIANFYGQSVSMISSAGTIVSNQGYTASGSLDRPQGIAVDGAGNIWIANYQAPYLTELAGAMAATPGKLLSPANGLGADAKLLEAYALAIDASGNLWVSSQGSNTVTKFIGLASPVKTPLSGLPAAP